MPTYIKAGFWAKSKGKFDHWLNLEQLIEQYSSGGIADAPSDGLQYARQNATWTEVTGGSQDLQQVLDTGNSSTTELNIRSISDPAIGITVRPNTISIDTPQGALSAYSNGITHFDPDATIETNLNIGNRIATGTANYSFDPNKEANDYTIATTDDIGVPLTGTVAGKPMTGNIQMDGQGKPKGLVTTYSPGAGLFYTTTMGIQGSQYLNFIFEFQNDNVPANSYYRDVRIDSTAIKLNGIIGGIQSSMYVAPVDDNAYTQKKFVIDSIMNPVLATYADNAAAIAGGLPVDRIYKTATGEIRIVV